MYTGDMVDGQKHGHGKYVYYDTTYEGEFKTDYYDGNGVLTNTTNYKYEGQFLQGQQNG